ncbi:MAG: DUF4965 domain-containing protein [Armatimonadetes bacterium]|nr:DUF4965 domain-containing protein [Armatimonadota bacterium]
MTTVSCDPAFRPPAVPLVTCDPYFSIWSTSDKLTDSFTKHWTGVNQTLAGMLRIDGTTYRFMAPGSEAQAMKQISLRVLPTRSIYEFNGGGVKLVVTFMTPLLLDDLDIMSRPVSYIEYDVASADGKEHDVTIYFEATGELVVDRANQKIEWGRYIRGGEENLQILRLGSYEQDILSRSGDDLRIDWGHLYVVFPNSPDNRGMLNSSNVSRELFAKEGVLLDSDDLNMPKAAGDGWNAAACTLGLGKVGTKSVKRLITLAYDDVYSIEYFNRKMRPYWRRAGWGAQDLISAAVRDYPELKKRCEAFDEELMRDATKCGGDRYAQILALAYRHAIAACKLVADVDGTPLFFSKENFSNGCIATVDIAYPASPIYMLLCPQLLKAMLEPVLQYSSSPMWPHDFAPHDLGTYPLANGQVYGGDAAQLQNQMPVEESGNMLIMLAVLSRLDGNADYAKRYWNTISAWAKYLRDKGLDPENQLCTDDFAGHLAHNTNLSLKAIVALACYADMAGILGDKQVAAEYRKLAESMAAKWKEMAADGDHYRLAFDQPGTWSMKYNLVWDKLLDLKLFDPDIAAAELAYYAKVTNPYGIPLDNRKPYTKPEWQIFVGTLSDSNERFEQIIDPIYKYMNETPSRVPFTDWYWTTDAKQVNGMQARPVVGGLFAKMLADPVVWKKWSKRGGK